MQYRKLGHTGVEVSTQCLGAMMFGAFGNRDHDECGRMIARALDAGINFVDTADMYSAGESEEIVGQAISGRQPAAPWTKLSQSAAHSRWAEPVSGGVLSTAVASGSQKARHKGSCGSRQAATVASGSARPSRQPAR